MATKKPRNYGATESTLTQLRKTRRDHLALTKRVRALESTVLEMAADIRALRLWLEPTVVKIERPRPIGKGARA
jgi:hypothetical protein